MTFDIYLITVLTALALILGVVFIELVARLVLRVMRDVDLTKWRKR